MTLINIFCYNVSETDCERVNTHTRERERERERERAWEREFIIYRQKNSRFKAPQTMSQTTSHNDSTKVMRFAMIFVIANRSRKRLSSSLNRVVRLF